MKQELFYIVEQHLGKGTQSTRNNVKFKCPFCNHHKKKLEIDLDNEVWHCWVCNEKGRSIYSLLNKMKVYPQILYTVKELSDIKHTKPTEIKVDPNVLQLPTEFIPLYKKVQNETITYKSVIKYLTDRGITSIDFERYNIGYCETGKYNNRIIIPSFDINNQLNYFVGRTLPKKSKLSYLTPDVKKDDIIPFENLINFDLDIYLVEGGFDAIALHYNTIPLFGKTIGKKLLQKLIETQPPNIYIILDNDAIKQSIGLIQKLQFNSIKSKIHLVELPNKTDPSVLGFKKTFELINKSAEFTTASMLKYKLKNKL